MKTKKIIKTTAIITLILAVVIIRLASNKENSVKEQQLISKTSSVVPVITKRVGLESTDATMVADGIFYSVKEVVIASEISGKVTSFNANVGSRVNAGQALAVLDHSVLDVQLQQAKANLLKLEKDMQRNEMLIKTDGVTEQQLEQTRQAVIDAKATLTSVQYQIDNSVIKAPFNGKITKCYIEVGSYLAQGNSVFDLSGVDNLKLIAKVGSDKIGSLNVGQKAIVTADDFSDTPLQGTVYSINDKADASKMYDVEISMNNTLNGRIKPGMFGKAVLSENNISKKLAIPRAAIPGSIKDAFVYVVKGDSAVLTKIQVVPLNEKLVSVVSGLLAGDLVVISGQINLSNGTKVNIVN
jgi:membrane fusion protein, multidrug efflux system